MTDVKDDTETLTDKITVDGKDPFADFVQEEYNDGKLVEPKRPTLSLVKKEEAETPAPADAQEVTDETETQEEEAPADNETADEKAFRERVETAAKKMAQKRIDQLTKTNRTLERDAAAARDAASAARAAPVDTKPVVVPPKPKAEDFDLGVLDEAYQEALYDHRDALKQQKAQEAAVEAQATRQAEAAASETQEYQAKLKTLIEGGDADFKKKVIDTAMADEWPLSETVARLAADSDVGREVLAHLASNLEEAREIFALPPLRQAARFGKIEDKLTATKAKPASAKAPSAPAVVEQTRGAGGKFTPATDTTDFAAFERAHGSIAQIKR